MGRPKSNITIEQRFLANVEKTETCWNWMGVTKKGYGYLRVIDKRCRAHRVAYEIWKGPIPDGLLIRHKCDNRACVNPEHLETGTDADNMRDKVERNRQIKGEKHGHSKLTEQQVCEIKVLLADTITCTEIAKQFNVNRTAISHIKHNKNWKHI